VLLCIYIRMPPGWPLHPTIIGRVRDGPTHFDTGGFLLCRCIHQTAAIALFLWGIWERETVTKSVASDMYYIMARFFDCAGISIADAQNTYPTQFTARYSLDVLKPSNIGQKLILRIWKYLLAYLKYGFKRGSATALSSLNPRILKGSKQ